MCTDCVFWVYVQKYLRQNRFSINVVQQCDVASHQILFVNFTAPPVFDLIHDACDAMFM